MMLKTLFDLIVSVYNFKNLLHRVGTFFFLVAYYNSTQTNMKRIRNKFLFINTLPFI